MHPNISISHFVINIYDIVIFLSYIPASLYLYCNMTHLENVKKEHVLTMLLAGLPVHYAGGLVIPFFANWIYGHHPLTLGAFLFAGRYFHSVFLVMLAYILIYCRACRWPTAKVLDHLAVATMIMSSIGRIGCFFQGCCRGTPASLPWCVRFPDDPGVCVHPVQLYMFFLEAGLAVFLWKMNQKKKYDGFTFWIGVLSYSIYRFLIEFVRTNPVFVASSFQGYPFPVTHAQAFSIGAIVLALIALARHD